MQGLRCSALPDGQAGAAVPEVRGLPGVGRVNTSVLGNYLERHRGEDEWALCRGDFPRFAAVAGRELQEHLGEEFHPYGEFHSTLARLAVQHRRAVVLAARDHIKSTIMSQLFPLWRAAYQHDGTKLRALLMSDTSKQAKRNLEHITLMVEEIPWLQHLKPEHPRTWKKTEVEFENGSRLEVVGFGSPVRGGHYHLVIMDDIIGDTQRYTFSFMKRFIKRAVIPMVKKGCQAFFVGTPQHELDPIMEFFKNPVWHAEKFPAVLDEETRRVLWPEHWDYASLMELREEIGKMAFTQEYQCEPVDDTSSMFPYEVLEACFASHLSLRNGADGTGFPVYAGVDIAKSARVGADWWVAVVVQLDEDGNRNILSVERERGLSLPEQVKRIDSINRRFGPEAIVVEANAMQSFVADEAARLTDAPVRPHTTGKEKASLEDGIPGMVVLFENRKYRIPRQTERDRQITDVLVDELRHIGWVGARVEGKGSHDDCAMALWLAEQGIRHPRRRVRRFVLR